MLRTLRQLIIATAILSLFLTFLTPSEAIEITQMYASYGGYEDHTGSLYHTATVKTDEPFYCVWWYIDDVYVGYSDGSNTATSASFSPNPSDYPGSSDGITYTIKAEVGWLEDDGDTHFDSDSYSVTVYAPCRETAASLTASITSCRWNGRTASVTSFATVEHTGGDDAPSVDYIINFGVKVSRLDANGAVAADIYVSPLDARPGTVDDGDAKVTENFSDSYTLGNGWQEGMTFEVYTRATVWAINNERNAVGQECKDEDSDTYTIPKN